MILTIAGSRNAWPSIAQIDAELKRLDWHPSKILSGGARGADTAGEEWAARRNVPVHRFSANWGLHGRSAGVLRNQAMAQATDAAILWWDGKSPGTKHMLETMQKLGKPVAVIQAQTAPLPVPTTPLPTSVHPPTSPQPQPADMS